MITKFYKVLFEPGELTCFSDDVKGTSLAKTEQSSKQFFSINAMHTSRADANVTSHRNILIEFDNLPLSKQILEVERLRLPYSTCVFSGNKSYHFIISLVTPIGATEYRSLIKRIYATLPDADKSVGNPSRFSRTPEVVRDNGVKQSLVMVKERVPNEALYAWLGPAPEVVKYVQVKFKSLDNVLTRRARSFFEGGGMREGGRNIALFGAAIDLFSLGWSFDKIYNKVIECCNLPDEEIRACIRSAERTSQKDY